MRGGFQMRGAVCPSGSSEQREPTDDDHIVISEVSFVLRGVWEIHTTSTYSKVPLGSSSDLFPKCFHCSSNYDDAVFRQNPKTRVVY